MRANIFTIPVTFILLILVDAFYFVFVGKYFDNQIKQIQGTPMKINIISFIMCYIFITFGLYYFIIKDKRPIYEAFLLGLVIYAIYELTNKAIISNWNWLTVFIDSLWGGILFAIVTAIIYKFMQ
jgi:uncharacterized membrane protein